MKESYNYRLMPFAPKARDGFDIYPTEQGQMELEAADLPCSELGDRDLGGFDERNHFAADLQFEIAHRAGGDD